jgi:PTS system ascorbate-specific IIA component
MIEKIQEQLAIIFEFNRRKAFYLIDEIKMQYYEIFELTKLALFPLRKLVQKDIPDEEIGYFTIAQTS